MKDAKGHGSDKRGLGAYAHLAHGPGFTMNKATGLQPTRGYAVAGAPPSAKHVGGGGGWPVEHVDVVHNLADAHALAAARGEQAIYDLARQETLQTLRANVRSGQTDHYSDGIEKAVHTLM